MMNFELTPEQQKLQTQFREWVDEHVVPFADQFDRVEETPKMVIQKLADTGYLGAMVSSEFGGLGFDPITWGLLCEEVGRGSASLLSLLTVHSMMIVTLSKWGTPEQKSKWLPKLAKGEEIGGFCLTEPNMGSDAKAIESNAEPTEGGYLLTAEKRWISFGATATLFMVFAKTEDKISAFLVEKGSAGLTLDPLQGMYGFRSANLADLHFEKVFVPESCMLGRPGHGFTYIASTALDQGRFCIGWGSVGLAQASLTASLSYASSRHQFGEPLASHQLIQKMITEMIVKTKAARYLGFHAGWLRMQSDPAQIMETSEFKYYASRIALEIADDAVQLHGANGVSSNYPVQRFLRDAKIMEIIEGSSQMHQIMISKSGVQHFQMGQFSKR